MRIVVTGASRLGVAIVSRLLESDHDVVLVDISRARLDEIAERIDCGFIEGDGTLPQTLRDAFGDGAEVLMMMTNQDDVNILGSVVGRSIGFERVILQIVRSELLDVCEELGFDEVVTPHITVARSIVSSIEGDYDIEPDNGATEDLHFATYPVPEGLQGETFGGLQLPDGARAVAVLRPEDEKSVDPDLTLEKGFELVIATLPGADDQLKEMFETQSE